LYPDEYNEESESNHEQGHYTAIISLDVVSKLVPWQIKGKHLHYTQNHLIAGLDKDEWSQE
jgi:hypothetical protein